MASKHSDQTAWKGVGNLISEKVCPLLKITGGIFSNVYIR